VVVKKDLLMNNVIEKLDHVLERIVYYAIYLAGIITLIMAFATTYGVVLRYAVNSPEHYTYEIGIFCLICSVCLALPYIQKRGRNLRVDFVANHFPPRVQAALPNIVVPLVALFYLVLLVWQSWGDAWHSLSIAERTYSAWAPPVGPMKLIVPVGVGLLCIVLILQLIHGLLTLRKK
jgi:TRAP-type C4-dicarboxylate transport system permease small subunit